MLDRTHRVEYFGVIAVDRYRSVFSGNYESETILRKPAFGRDKSKLRMHDVIASLFEDVDNTAKKEIK